MCGVREIQERCPSREVLLSDLAGDVDRLVEIGSRFRLAHAKDGARQLLKIVNRVSASLRDAAS
jgi:hypothetical protein